MQVNICRMQIYHFHNHYFLIISIISPLYAAGWSTNLHEQENKHQGNAQGKMPLKRL